jgi:hypothetical protein
VIVGSPGTVLARIVEVVRRFRIGNLHVMLQFGSMPRPLAMDNIGLFAATVLPALRGLWTDERWEHHWWPERLGGRPVPEAAGVRAAGDGR